MVGSIELPVNEENLPLICEKLQESEVHKKKKKVHKNTCQSLTFDVFIVK